MPKQERKKESIERNWIIEGIKINKTPNNYGSLTQKMYNENIISLTLIFSMNHTHTYIRINQEKMPEANFFHSSIFFGIFKSKKGSVFNILKSKFEKEKCKKKSNTCVHAYNWAHVF